MASGFPLGSLKVIAGCTVVKVLPIRGTRRLSLSWADSLAYVDIDASFVEVAVELVISLDIDEEADTDEDKLMEIFEDV